MQKKKKNYFIEEWEDEKSFKERKDLEELKKDQRLLREAEIELMKRELIELGNEIEDTKKKFNKEKNNLIVLKKKQTKIKPNSSDFFEIDEKIIKTENKIRILGGNDFGEGGKLGKLLNRESILIDDLVYLSEEFPKYKQKTIFEKPGETKTQAYKLLSRWKLQQIALEKNKNEQAAFENLIENDKISFGKKFNKVSEPMVYKDLKIVSDICNDEKDLIVKNECKLKESNNVDKYYRIKKDQKFAQNWITTINENESIDNLRINSSYRKKNPEKKQIRKLFDNNYIDVLESRTDDNIYCVIGDSIFNKKEIEKFDLDFYDNKLKFLELIKDFELEKKKEENKFIKENKTKNFPEKSKNGGYYIKLGNNFYDTSKIKNWIEDSIIDSNKSLKNQLFDNNNEFLLFKSKKEGFPLIMVSRDKIKNYNENVCFLDSKKQMEKDKNKWKNSFELNTSIFKDISNIKDFKFMLIEEKKKKGFF